MVEARPNCPTDGSGMIVEDEPSRADVEWLEEQINAFNIAATGCDDGGVSPSLMRSPAGTIIAGIYGGNVGRVCPHRLALG